MHVVACGLVFASQLDLQFAANNFVFISDDEIHVMVRTLLDIFKVDTERSMRLIFGDFFHKKINDGACRLKRPFT